MSIHDETWDKCPKCRQTIKSWNFEFHDSGECLNFDSWYIYNELKRIKENKPNLDTSPFGFQTYIPEIWHIPKDTIYSAIASLQVGLEYAQECLILHDQNLGRTIPRNKREAEYIEEHITQIKKSINDLNKQK